MRISDWSSDVCSSDLSSAGDDEIRVGDSGGLGGDDLPQIAGDALATGEDGDAFASNFVASVDGNTTGEHSAGNDTITAGDGGWFIAGDALASGRNGNASVNNNAEIGRASCRERVCQYV